VTATSESLRRIVKFQDAVKDRTGGQYKVQKRDYLHDGQIPIIDQGQSAIAGYTNDDNARFSGELPVVLFGDHTLVFKYVDFPFALGADGVKVLSIDNVFDPKYVFYYWQSRSLQSRGYSRHFKFLKEIDLPLIPISEQKRIAKILDQANALRKRRAEADLKAARILPALFYKMFGDPITNPKRLAKKKLGDLIKVRSGNFLPAKNMEPEGRYPVYGGNGINGYHSEFMFEQPVIVLGRVGAYCGAVHYSQPRCWVTDNALYVADRSEKLHPRYLAEALRLANLNQYAGRAGQPLISASRIYPVAILVPDLEDQERFAFSVEELHRDEKHRKDADAQMEKLFSVLLHRAFSGELTAKWRETHMKELLAEMEAQAKSLDVSSAAE
jgi:type I restriction enzyme, S subunit